MTVTAAVEPATPVQVIVLPTDPTVPSTFGFAGTIPGSGNALVPSSPPLSTATFFGGLPLPTPLSGGGDTGSGGGDAPPSALTLVLPRSEFAPDKEPSEPATPLSRVLSRADADPNDPAVPGMKAGLKRGGGDNPDSTLLLGQSDLKASLLGSSALGADDSVWTVEAIAAAAEMASAVPSTKAPPDLWRALAANAAASTPEQTPNDTPAPAPEPAWPSWRTLIIGLGTAAAVVLTSSFLRRFAKSCRSHRNLRPTIPIPTKQRQGPASA
jgi:hypothetical protein